MLSHFLHLVLDITCFFVFVLCWVVSTLGNPDKLSNWKGQEIVLVGLRNFSMKSLGSVVCSYHSAQSLPDDLDLLSLDLLSLSFRGILQRSTILDVCVTVTKQLRGVFSKSCSELEKAQVNSVLIVR